MFQYCSKCILPDTRPGLTIKPDGICNACHSSLEKEEKIDWSAREKSFQKLVEEVKQKDYDYHCLIPVSGGKDSHWQVIKCLEYGLHPLCLTWKTPARTEIGRKNLKNLISLGVDHVDFQVNPKTESKFMLQALKKYGNPAVSMHMGLFNIPLNFAVKFNIPLVVWGENSAFEYGGQEEEHKGFSINSDWIKKYGITYNTVAEDWISRELTKEELTPFFRPSDQELQEKGIRGIFLGYYFNWDPETSLRAARLNGFQVREAGPKVGLYNYADIDDDFISITHYIKWYKFGMTRLFDNLSLEIRNGRLSRTEALDILRRQGTQRPDEDIEKFCKFTKISRKRFFEILERFRNQDIWLQENGVWKIKDFIIPDWPWQADRGY